MPSLATETSNKSTMKTWIDERPFEVMIQEDVSLPPRTVRDYDFDVLLPASKFDYIADMITRDPNIFKSDSTLYDIRIVHLERKLQPLTKNLEKIQKEFETIGTDKDALNELILKERAITIEKKRTEEHLAYYKALQDIARKEFVTLNRVANIYKKNGDSEFLRKGAHWAGTYANSLIAKIQVPDDLKQVKNS
jgi:hypothetical protein